MKPLLLVAMTLGLFAAVLTQNTTSFASSLVSEWQYCTDSEFEDPYGYGPECTTVTFDPDGTFTYNFETDYFIEEESTWSVQQLTDSSGRVFIEGGQISIAQIDGDRLSFIGHTFRRSVDRRQSVDLDPVRPDPSSLELIGSWYRSPFIVSDWIPLELHIDTNGLYVGTWPDGCESRGAWTSERSEPLNENQPLRLTLIGSEQCDSRGEWPIKLDPYWWDDQLFLSSHGFEPTPPLAPQWTGAHHSRQPEVRAWSAGSLQGPKATITLQIVNRQDTAVIIDTIESTVDAVSPNGDGSFSRSAMTEPRTDHLTAIELQPGESTQFDVQLALPPHAQLVTAAITMSGPDWWRARTSFITAVT